MNSGWTTQTLLIALAVGVVIGPITYVAGSRLLDRIRERRR